MAILLVPIWAATPFSPPGCEFTVRIPGEMRPMEKQTEAGLVRGGVSEIILKGSARKLFFSFECSQGPKFNFDLPNAGDLLIATLVKLNLSFGLTGTSYDVSKNSLSVLAISKGTLKKISTDTVMRTEMHLGRNSLLILRVIGKQFDVDKIIANQFFNSVSR